MARPKQDHPTAAELEVLKVLWDSGPASVREVMDILNETRPRAYTSVMSLLNVMADKGLLQRIPQGRLFLYKAKADRNRTLRGMVDDLLGRAFEGSASQLVALLLDQSKPTHAELDEIRRAIEAYRQRQEPNP
jgi:predicted transcriptional regulator